MSLSDTWLYLLRSRQYAKCSYTFINSSKHPYEVDNITHFIDEETEANCPNRGYQEAQLVLSEHLCGKWLPPTAEYGWWKMRPSYALPWQSVRVEVGFYVPKKPHEVLGHFQRGNLASKRDVGLCGIYGLSNLCQIIGIDQLIRICALSFKSILTHFPLSKRMKSYKWDSFDAGG